MKNVLIGVGLLVTTSIAFAECTSTLTMGQFNQDCEASANERSIEYSLIPYNNNAQANKQNNVATLEQSVAQAYVTQTNFKPTHTQLDQVKQLLDYAESQGCRWEGSLEKPLLICPE